MISKIMVFLRDQLASHLSSKPEFIGGEASRPPVVFRSIGEAGAITFESDAISVLLVNIEEERALRSSDPYRTVGPDGAYYEAHPEIRLNLYVLFVANFQDYERALRCLSLLIQYFQSHRVLSRHDAPPLSEDFDRLVIELVTLTFSEQNELWSSLRAAYRPSVLYRVKMAVLKDEDAVPMHKIREIKLEVSSKLKPKGSKSSC